MKNKVYSVEGSNISPLPDLLEKQFKLSRMSVSNTAKTLLFVSEKYSFIQNSDMACIIFVDIISENKCILNFIVAGVNAGLLRLDLFNREESAINDFNEALQKMCVDNGWKSNSS